MDGSKVVGQLNILFVIDRFDSPGAGTEGQLFRLVRALKAAGHEVRLLVLADSPWIQANGFPCPVDSLGRTQVRHPSTWWALIRYASKLKRAGVQLVHCFFNDASVLCPPVFGGLFGLPVVISRRDMGFWYTPLYRKVLPVTGKWVRHCVANSQAVADVTHEVEKLPRDRIEVIYNGYCPPPDAQDPPEDLVAFKASHDTVFVLVANQRPIKRIQDAIMALAEARKTAPTAGLVLIGGGDWTALRQLAQEKGCAEHVLFMGPRADAVHCLKWADVGLLCSESEGFSNAIVEYMQAGLPVICSDGGGNAEAVTDGQEGYIYPVGDVPALVQAMLRLATAPVLRETMGAKARESAHSRFSMQAMLNCHERLYRTLLGAV